MLDIASKFRERFAMEYRQESGYEIDDMLGSKISLAKRVGKHVQSLGLSKNRDGEGIYIFVPTEIDRIKLLVRRYGLEDIVDKLGQEPQF